MYASVIMTVVKYKPITDEAVYNLLALYPESSSIPSHMNVTLKVASLSEAQ